MSAIKEKLCAGQGSVASKIKELNNIISAFDNRLNLFVGLILNGFLLWDFHCIMKLEKWRRSAASGLPVWLNLLGKADGLNSLANYSFNNPDNFFSGGGQKRTSSGSFQNEPSTSEERNQGQQRFFSAAAWTGIYNNRCQYGR